MWWGDERPRGVVGVVSTGATVKAKGALMDQCSFTIAGLPTLSWLRPCVVSAGCVETNRRVDSVVGLLQCSVDPRPRHLPARQAHAPQLSFEKLSTASRRTKALRNPVGAKRSLPTFSSPPPQGGVTGWAPQKR